jgi:hypothetical protein
MLHAAFMLKRVFAVYQLSLTRRNAPGYSLMQSG